VSSEVFHNTTKLIPRLDYKPAVLGVCDNRFDFRFQLDQFFPVQSDMLLPRCIPSSWAVERCGRQIGRQK
jgi:hypothetical protein